MVHLSCDFLLFIIACCACFIPQREGFQFSTSIVGRPKTALAALSNDFDVPRPRLQLPFAVQLMRSSYNAVDDLDFVAMDDFQRQFFLLRQRNWEDYLSKHPRILQGDLADPYYFDFISYAQYATINQVLMFAKKDFIEKVGAEGQTQVVRRPLQYLNNDLLPSVHAEIVGQSLLTFLTNQSISLQSEVQGVKSKNIDQFVAVGNLLLSSMQALGYSVSAALTELPLTTSSSNLLDRNVNRLLQVRLQAPANLWSIDRLTYLRSPLVNDFEVKVLQALASRMQVQVTVLSTLATSKNLELIHNLECSIK